MTSTLRGTPLGRRGFLRLAGGAAAVTALPAGLAACGGSSGGAGGPSGWSAWPTSRSRWTC